MSRQVSDKDSFVSVDRRRFLRETSAFIPGAVSSLPFLAGKTASAYALDPIANTASGKVRGVNQDGINVFRGIPYGGNTTGKNRFLPPEKPAPWRGVRDALNWGPLAPQPRIQGSEDFRALFQMLDEGHSEDCLVLNVWTPALKGGEKRPVMVWLHGGGFTFGSGAERPFNGKALARGGNVVVVTVNHRLGCLGYLDLSGIGGPAYEKSSNAGMLDIVAALEWVRDNIESFGGNPGNVTLFGWSGGGRKTSTLLGMPAANRLFHRAIIQSGPQLRSVPRETSNKVAERFLAELKLNGTGFGELQQIPWEKLIAAQAVVAQTMQTEPFKPVMDGNVVPDHQFDPVAPAISANIPLIIGCNHDEATYMLAGDRQLYSLDQPGLAARVRRMVKNDGDRDRLIRTYERVYPGASATDLMIQIFTDQVERMPSVWIAERKAVLRRAPVYMYRFNWKSPAFGGKYGSTHGAEVPFVFDNVGPENLMTGASPEAYSLARKISRSWVAFAHTGDPNITELPRWPTYAAEKRATMICDNRCRVEDDPGGPEIRAIWNEVR